MLDQKEYLTTKQMAQFVTNGFLVFEEMVPTDLCEQAELEMSKGIFQVSKYGKGGYIGQGKPLKELWNGPSIAIHQIFNSPRMTAIMESLMGPNPLYDHHFPHLTKANTIKGEDLHQDAEYDARHTKFDIQISFYPLEVTLNSGGTLFIPGSHFRRVHERVICRYQNIVGQKQLVCPAGTIVIWHHNLWHSARSNRSDQDRYMFKVRLNPSCKQELTWDCRDLHDPKINEILGSSFAWQGALHRVEVINRVKLWRSLTGQKDFDLFSRNLLRTEI